MANGTFKDGAGSRYVPSRLIEKYERIAADPDILSLRHDIALLDARRDELLQELSSSSTWVKIQEAATSLRTDRTPEALELLLSTIDAGSTEQSVWAEWAALGEQRRKHTDSERQRLKDLNAMITAEQGMMVVVALLSSVKRHVQDVTALRAISADVAALMTRNPRAPATTDPE